METPRPASQMRNAGVLSPWEHPCISRFFHEKNASLQKIYRIFHIEKILAGKTAIYISKDNLKRNDPGISERKRLDKTGIVSFHFFQSISSILNTGRLLPTLFERREPI